ncbi:GumC family protein [Jannaschia marina]|uniref:GumC family protein n=1 Tax=Jannaschia marina TaxID=2741674 RepID=UPI0015C7BCEB|nr:exopolysaccharide transport family protein [Jannaschia marina]
MNQRVPPSQPFRPTPEPQDGGIELGTLLAGLRRSKWIILLCVVLAGALAYASVKLIRPSYFSYVEVLLDTRQERVVGVEQVVSDLNVTNSVVAGEIAVMRSNVLLGRVVDDLGLVTHPDFDPTLDSGPSLIDRAMIRLGWAEPMPEAEGTPETGLTEADRRNIVIWKVRRNLSAYQDGISYVISVSMRAHDPELAAAVANAVAEQYIQDQLNAKLSATQRAIAWLDNRLIELETQLREAEDAVVDFTAQQVIEEGGDEQSVALQLAEMNRMIVAARDDRAAAEARLSHTRSLMAETGPEGAAAALDTPRLVRLDGELAALERERAQLATRLGPRHPEMLEVQLALDDLRRDRLDAIRAGVAELEAEVAQAYGREASIAADIQTAQLLQVDLSRASVRLSQLSRSASAMRQVYESFLARFQETTQQLEFQRPDARVITRAEPALAPARPRGKLILAVALVLGTVLGMVAALIREVNDPAPRTARDLSGLTNLPVIGVVPEVWRRGRFFGRAGAWQTRHLRRVKPSRYVQALTMLHGTLRATDWTRGQVLLVTGSEEGAGATTTALGLARLSARAGERVAIVEADPSRTALRKRLGSGRAVADGTEVEPNLFFYRLESGEDLRARAEAMAVAYSSASGPVRHCDVVIVDAPPVNESAITRRIAAQADSVLLVARSHRSRSYVVALAADLLLKSGANVAGAVLSFGGRNAMALGLTRRTPPAPAAFDVPAQG